MGGLMQIINTSTNILSPNNNLFFTSPLSLLSSLSPLDDKRSKNSINAISSWSNKNVIWEKYGSNLVRKREKSSGKVIVASSITSGNAPLWNNDTWSPDKSSPSPSFSDVLWPSLGAFAAMAMLGKIDQTLATRGVSSITIAPLGAVCAVLFITPKSPAAKKYNMFLAQIGCAAIGVLAFSIFGPGWLARSTALAASIAFMIATKSTHPPAASLPLVFIDGAKFHGLNFWYVLFPGAAGCILIALIQEIVTYMQQNFKF